MPRQSSVRLMHELRLKELGSAIERYQSSHGRIPEDLEELKSAGGISDFSDLEEFEYIRGDRGILAFRREPFRRVRKGEPWGGAGEVAKYEIPAARLVLFADGSIKFVDELDFQEKYEWLLGRIPPAKNEGISGECRPGTDLGFGLEELIPGMNWSQWYRQESGYAPDPDFFGAYVTLAVRNDLYIGLGTGLPTLGDGALVVRFNGENVQPVGSLAEEGIHEMIWDDYTGILHIAGTDPSWPDDWSAGNHYTYTPYLNKTIVKHRDPERGLLNVIHTWGLWLSEDHMLYAAVNAHDGSFTRDRNLLRRLFNRINSMVDRRYYSTDYGVTRMGQIFKSEDSGKTWGHVSDVGYFRAYDVVASNDKLYALYTDTPESPCKIAVSDDDAKKWRDVSQLQVQRVHLVSFHNELMAVSFDGKRIYAVNSDAVGEYDLPKGFRIESYFNVLAIGNDYLYAACKADDGTYSILRTRNLRDWEEVVCTDKSLISLSFWENRNWLITGSAGIDATLWKIDLNQSERIRIES